MISGIPLIGPCTRISDSYVTLIFYQYHKVLYYIIPYYSMPYYNVPIIVVVHACSPFVVKCPTRLSTALEEARDAQAAT